MTTTLSNRPIARHKALKLVERLADADRTPTELARELGISLADLAAWINHPPNARLIAGVARLADLRTQLTLSRFRVNAAAMLINIAAGRTEGSELARKACADLLNATLNVFADEHKTGASKSGPLPQTPAAPTEKAILRALEALGADDVAPEESEQDSAASSVFSQKPK